MMKIILASASPRRRELLKLITPDFEAVSTDTDETLPADIAPEKASEYLAGLKASAAAEEYPDALVIGCDTTVICDGRILGKPSDKQECLDFMHLFSGRTHQVITGCAVACGGRTESFSQCTDVTFRELTEEEIQNYAASDEPYDKAGGYGIQGRGALLISGISGDYFNVVGLPVSALYQVIKKYIKEI